MRQFLKDYALVGAIALLVAVMIAGRPEAPAVSGQDATMTLTDLDGQSIALGQGAPTILNFWATWCGPCRQEIPAFSRFAETHPEITVVGLAVDSGSTGEIRAAAKKWGIRYPVGIAEDDVISQFKVSTLPTTVIIRADGVVKEAHVGVMSEGQLKAAVQ